MTTPTERIRNEPEKLYKSIRDARTREALRGRRWILIHASGIPLDTVTTETAYKAFLRVESIMPSKLDEAKAQDLIKGGRITGREFLKRYRSGVYT